MTAAAAGIGALLVWIGMATYGKREAIGATLAVIGFLALAIAFLMSL